jgi:nucleoid-associated protein YgaU
VDFNLTMKKPVVVFTSIAALAVAALGTTIYMQKKQVMPVVAKVETPAVPKPAEKPIEQAVITAKPVETPAAATDVPKQEPAAPLTPSFDTVRVEKTGEAIIAGRADPDSDVVLKWNGTIVGQTKANADGSFVLVPDNPLKKGTGALTIQMTKNGNMTESEGSVIVSVQDNAPALVAKINPVAPTEVVQSAAPTDMAKDVQLTSVDYDARGNIVFSGRATPGSIVRFYVDNAVMGEGVANDAGAWSFNGTTAISPGTHTLRADALDKDGKVLSRIELPFLREDAATVAATQVAAVEPPKEEAATRAVEIEKPAEPAPVATQEMPEPQVATVEATPAPVIEDGPRKIVVQPGNSLWKLSREVYGKGRMYTIIYKANRDQLKSPRKIYPGQILTAPKQK